jgi:putative endonuclease
MNLFNFLKLNFAQLKSAKPTNVGVRHGSWGEDVAYRFLRRRGLKIIERNERPVASDKRLEIDIIAFDPKVETLVFVEVKQHARISPFAKRLSKIDKRKKRNLKRACKAWLRAHRWCGNFRFDVVEIYGTPEGGSPIIDHIEKVNLFAQSERFVKWS